MIGLIFNILAATGLVLLTGYLVCVRVKHIPVANKYRGTPSFDLYRKIYTSRFLVISAGFTLLALLNIAYQVFVSRLGSPSSFIENFYFIVRLITSIILFYLIFLLIRKK